MLDHHSLPSGPDSFDQSEPSSDELTPEWAIGEADSRLVQAGLPAYTDLAEAMSALLTSGDLASRDRCIELLHELGRHIPLLR